MCTLPLLHFLHRRPLFCLWMTWLGGVVLKRMYIEVNDEGDDDDDDDGGNQLTRFTWKEGC